MVISVNVYFPVGTIPTNDYQFVAVFVAFHHLLVNFLLHLYAMYNNLIINDI